MSHRTDDLKKIKLIFSKEGMVFSNEEGWNTLLKQIEDHNNELNGDLGYGVSFDDALFSYYENIFRPVIMETSSRRVRFAFPKKSAGDLYLAVSAHWLGLMSKDKNIFADKAADSYVATYGKNLLSRLFKGTDNGDDNDHRRKKAA